MVLRRTAGNVPPTERRLFSSGFGSKKSTLWTNVPWGWHLGCFSSATLFNGEWRWAKDLARVALARVISRAAQFRFCMPAAAFPNFGPLGRWLFFFLIVLTPQASAEGLTIMAERGSPFDLEISSGLEGQPEGEARFVSWEDIYSLPSSQLELEGEFVPGKQTITIIFLDDLWNALPVDPANDTLTAFCTDGYFSVYQPDFMAAHKPFVVVPPRVPLR